MPIRHFTPRSIFSRHALRGLATAAALSVGGFALAADKPVVEVTFVLDTTGSMTELIDGAKKKIWSIATSIVDENPNAEIRMALIAYRDVGDDYVTKRFDLTDDIQDMYRELLALRADGGGDWEESVNEALDVALTKVSWGQSARDTRIIFLVGDAPPHMDYDQDRKYPVIVKEAAKRGIIVNAVQAGTANDTRKVWRSIAQLGEGKYIALPQDGGQVAVIDTPFDDRIRRLQIDIDQTIVIYGDRERQSKVRSKLEQRAAAPAPSAADESSYIFKKSRGKDVVTGSGDLVTDLERGVAKLDELKPGQMPQELAGLSPAEQRTRLKTLADKRATLAAQMADAVAERDRYIAAAKEKLETGALGDSFDRAVEETLRAQMKK
jgi:hypothetical protein